MRAEDGETINDLIDKCMDQDTKALFDDKQLFCLRNEKSGILLVMVGRLRLTQVKSRLHVSGIFYFGTTCLACHSTGIGIAPGYLL